MGRRWRPSSCRRSAHGIPQRAKAIATSAGLQATAIAFSPDGSLLAVGCGDGSVSFLDPGLKTLPLRLGGRASALTSLSFEKDRPLAALARDMSLALWDPESLRLRRQSSDEVLVSYLNPGGERVELHRSLIASKALALSPDGKLAVYKSSAWEVEVIDLAQGKYLRRLSLFFWPQFEVTAFFMSPDSRSLVLTGRDISGNYNPTHSGIVLDWERQVLLFDLVTGKGRALVGATGLCKAVAFSPDMKTLASSGLDFNGEGILVWDIASGRKIRALKTEAAKPITTALAFSPDGKFLAAGDRTGVGWLFDLGTGQRKPAMVGRFDSLAFDSGGRRLFAGGSDGVVCVWDTASCRELAAAMVSPEGEWIAWTPS